MTEEKPRKVPRFVSCLVKGPLGCLSFLIGVAVVLVLFLPSALGRLADHSLEDWFAERHEGSLQLTDVWLGSLYSEQRIESLILRDPNDDEVLRASVRAPALWDFLNEDEVRYGPLEIHVNTLRLVEQEGGVLNLVRAWQEREDAPYDPDDLDPGFRTDVPVIVDLVLLVDRLRLLDRGGAETQLANLELRGSLEMNNDDLRLVLEGGGTPARSDGLHVRIEVERLDGRSGVAWKHSWTVERAPTPLAEHLFTPRLPLAALAGPVLDELSWSRQQTKVKLRLRDQESSFSLEGNVSDDGSCIEGEKDDDDEVVELEFPLGNAGAAEALAAFLPFVRELEPASDSAAVDARLENYRWPLAGGWSGLSGDLELDLQELRFVLDPALEAHSGKALRPVPGKLERSLRIEEGRALFEDFRLPLEDGWLALEGGCDLATHECELTVRAEIAGERHDLGPWDGDARALAPTPPLPPEPPETESETETEGELPEDG